MQLLTFQIDVITFTVFPSKQSVNLVMNINETV